ncbi:MAG: DUF1549 domain-containing protein [Armatimonas sp.]
MRLVIATLAALGVAGVTALAQNPPTPASPAALDHFEKQVRPLLLEKCVVCHKGSEASGGLQLDKPITKEKAAEVLRRIKGVQGKDMMPPSGKLSAAHIAALEQWVNEGAPYPVAASTTNTTKKAPAAALWSFVPPKRVLAPPIDGAPTDIDAFIMAKVQKAGLTSAPLADRRTLLRRLTFDLTGLPPTPKEVEDFLADTSPNAYEKQVDRLLASPAYGQKWARHWLDVARYADSNGLDENLAHGYAWRYRDWVVDAINQDLPYNDFLTYQLAGDLLTAPNDDTRNAQITATGFLTLGPKVLAEQDKPKLVMDIIDEQIDVVTKATMGLTVACARCHDHKFDPISTKDYYALAGMFKSTRTMANLDFVSRWNERPLTNAKLQAEQKAYEETVAPLKTALDTARKQFDGILSAGAGALTANADAYVRGENLSKGNYGPNTINSAGQPNRAEWDFTLPKAGNWTLYVRYAAEESRPVNFTVGGQKLNKKAAGTTGGWNEESQRWEKAGSLQLAEGACTVVLENIGGPIPHFSKIALLPESAGDLTGVEEQIQKATKALKDAEAKRPEIPMVMAVEDGKIEDVKVHRRGSTQDLGDLVPRGFPAALCGGNRLEVKASEGSGRLAFAHWLTRAEHPLTARVAVNRVWQKLFGEGIVASADNWGVRGEKPSHLELLDYLALTFAEDDNWSQKKLLKRLVLTRTYRQAGGPKTDADPENRLLAHANRRRLEAEPLRDSLFFVAGTLDASLGGSLLGTKDGDYVTNDQSGNGARYDAPRRALYLPIIRNAVFDYFQAFDFGDPSLVNAKRPSTLVAPQALYLLNSPLVRTQSKEFAQSLKGTEEEKIALVYQRAYQRLPFPAESDRAETFLIRVRRAGGSEADAWGALCQTILASNEFLYVD